MSRNPPDIGALSATQRDELNAWVAEHRAELPPALLVLLTHFELLVTALGSSRCKLAQLAQALRRAMGIAPTSERRSSRRPLGPPRGKRATREKIRSQIEDAARLREWHLDLARKSEQRMMRLEGKLDALPEDDAPTPEEQAELARREQQFIEHIALGSGPDPALARSNESLMTGPQVTVVEEELELPAPPAAKGDKQIECFTEERVRHDFTIVVGKVIADVEKRVVVTADGQRRMLSGSTLELGPPRFSVTWRFLVNLTMLVGQYAMPMHRLGRLLSTDEKSFTASSLSRMLRYVAERFMPVYLELFRQLAHAEVLSGDDTPPRVLEVKRYFAGPQPRPMPPWYEYRTREVAAQAAAPLLEHELARMLGFEFPRRDGSGAKQALNTTILSGRAEEADPRSLINFYRSHLGGFGNLLEVLLHQRPASARDVVVQSDLATVNLVADPDLRTRFDIRYAGCAAHARRPFALYEDQDPELCEPILHLFQGIAIHEHSLDLHGRNAENVTAVRQHDTRRFWDDIRRWCAIVANRWSAQTKLGDAARYVLRNFDKLIVYLDDPRLDPTNNFRERLLRPEKLIENGSMFRASLSGRFVLDILRTVMQTAVAAGAPLQEYLLFVLMSSPEDVAAHPDHYTPRAWSKVFDEALAADAHP